MNKTILVTGGHITPAIAVISEIQRNYPDWHIILVGREIALEENRVASQEKRLAKQFNVSFIPIRAGRFTRTFTRSALFSLLKIPLGFFEALRIIARVQPDLILSFGGYIALPLVVSGKLQKIPVVTHEQTHALGLSNRIISIFADRVCLAFPGTSNAFFSQKTVVTGLPIRQEVFQQGKILEGVDVNRPLLFFSGGNTGSRSLNKIIYDALPKLLKKYMVVHQSGELSYREAKNIRHALQSNYQKYYLSVAYIDAPIYAWLLHNSKLIIGRSGANTVGEIAALGGVALWVPLPWSGANEQRENANYLVAHKTSQQINQKILTAEILIQTIEDMLKQYDTYKKNALLLGKTFQKDGAQRVAHVVYEILQKK